MTPLKMRMERVRQRGKRHYIERKNRGIRGERGREERTHSITNGESKEQMR